MRQGNKRKYNTDLSKMPYYAHTLGKLAPSTAIMPIVEEQTKAAELDKPDPTRKHNSMF